VSTAPTLVYVAGPFRGATLLNSARAATVSALAVRQGYAPICVHPAIDAGAYGNDDVPEERERGLAAVTALVEIVARAGGELWVILRHDGTPSEGTRREMEAFTRAAPEGRIRTGVWAVWERRCGLGEVAGA
jgi:hypothetical protein